MEILNAPDNKLFDYVQIVSNNKKTHISSWYQRVCLDHAIYKFWERVHSNKNKINYQVANP